MGGGAGAFLGHPADKEILLVPVALAEKQDAVAGLPVPARPPGFLVIAFNGPGQGVVNYQSYIRLVNPHPEGNGGGDHRNRAVNKPLLRAPPGVRVQPGVVGQRRMPARRQQRRHLLRILAGKAIDDGGLPPPFV